MRIQLSMIKRLI